MEPTLETPTEELKRTILYGYAEIDCKIAELRIKVEKKQCRDYMKEVFWLKGAITHLVGLASFDKKFHDDIKDVFEPYAQGKICRRKHSPHKAYTIWNKTCDYTLTTVHVWKRVSVALRENKLITLGGE